MTVILPTPSDRRTAWSDAYALAQLLVESGVAVTSQWQSYSYEGEALGAWPELVLAENYGQRILMHFRAKPMRNGSWLWFIDTGRDDDTVVPNDLSLRRIADDLRRIINDLTA